MPRTVREATLSTRSARLRLPVRSKPYWRALESGLHFGYRRRSTGGSWIVRRRRDDGRYQEGRLGLADDLQDADGEVVLDFSQAQVASRLWWLNEQRIEQGIVVPTIGPYTVKRACEDYLEDYNVLFAMPIGVGNVALEICQIFPRPLADMLYRMRSPFIYERNYRLQQRRKRPPPRRWM